MCSRDHATMMALNLGPWCPEGSGSVLFTYLGTPRDQYNQRSPTWPPAGQPVKDPPHGPQKKAGKTD